MKLSHLLLTIFLECLLVLPLAWLLGRVGVSAPLDTRIWISIPLAMIGAIAVAWPFARLLRMPPLMIFSGPCPACKRRPPGWWNSKIDTDHLQLACGECGQRVDLWLTSLRRVNIASSDVPTYVLRWLSTPVQNPTVPPVENPTDRRGDEPQIVAAS